MHSEGILAGELKHGPLALIDKQMPVIMVIMKDPCFTKCQNALQQITARQVSSLNYHSVTEEEIVHGVLLLPMPQKKDVLVFVCFLMMVVNKMLYLHCRLSLQVNTSTENRLHVGWFCLL